MKRYISEIKVGIFLVGALFILLVVALSIKEVSFLKGSYVLKVKFEFAEGLKPASPVRFLGVNVGEVNKVEVKVIDNQPVVYVYAKIKKEIRIPEGSKFFINSLSVFGEKYLEIIPPKEVTSFLEKDVEVQGISATPLFNIMDTFHKTVLKLEKLIEEEELRASLREIILNIKGVSSKLNDILEGVRNKEGTLGRLIYDDSLYRETEELIKDLKAHPWKLLHKPRKRR